MNTRIKEAREALELSQNDFAERLGLQRNSISLIENGKRNASSRTLNDICREFGINESWLRTGDGEMFVNSTTQNFKEFMSIVKDLSPELQDYMLNQAKSLLELQRSKKV